MKKSVYSLVLMDEVVEAVDRMAYREGTSRSNLINQILAEHLSCVTPEMRMRDIFSSLEQMLSGERYQIQNQASDAMFSVRSPIRYKYKPTVRYSIELYRKPEQMAGELRVSVRTSSQSFVDAIGQFFLWWIRMENHYLGRIYPEGVPCEYESGKYRRGFLNLEEADREMRTQAGRGSGGYAGEYAGMQGDSAEQETKAHQTGEAIGEYIKVLDQCLKYYFEHQEESQMPDRIRVYYENYLTSGISLI